MLPGHISRRYAKIIFFAMCNKKRIAEAILSKNVDLGVFTSLQKFFCL